MVEVKDGGAGTIGRIKAGSAGLHVRQRRLKHMQGHGLSWTWRVLCTSTIFLDCQGIAVMLCAVRQSLLAWQ